jgi:hypothetical protein
VLYKCLFDVKPPEDDVKKIDTAAVLADLYEKVHFQYLYLLVSAINKNKYNLP